MEAKALERSVRDERAQLLHVCHKGLQIRTLGNIVTENRKSGGQEACLIVYWFSCAREKIFLRSVDLFERKT